MSTSTPRKRPRLLEYEREQPREVLLFDEYYIVQIKRVDLYVGTSSSLNPTFSQPTTARVSCLNRSSMCVLSSQSIASA